MIEFLAEWMVTLLMPASHVLEVRAPHLSFMMLKEYWFGELYLGLKVTASFDRSESYTRVIDGQVRYITPEVKLQNLQNVDMEKPSQWVSKLCRLYFADEYAKRTVGLPSRRHVPDIAGALRAVQTILPKLEVE